MSEMKCKRCGANENRIHGFCSMECETAWYYEDDIRDLTARIAELEEERRWKDSNVELPKEDTDGNALLVICRYSGEWARAPFGIEFSDEFVRHYSHWMIAPELPEVHK